MNRFLVLPRVRRGEFKFGIVDQLGREVANLNDEAATRWIANLMNANQLNEEKIAALQIVTLGESYRRSHTEQVLRIKRHA